MVQLVDNPDLVVDAKGLVKVFKDFWGRPKARAVNGLDLAIRRGEVFGLLGPNGSGKSTTVKLLLGLLYPTRGSLQVFGESPRNVAVKRRIGYLPEESYLYRYLTAWETLDFFGALFGISSEERQRRADQLLEMVGLATARNRPVGEFSKGMARRVGLAQALINDPDLVILDEPTSGLDPIGCREVKDLIQLLARRGKTVILCSHLLADVEDVCDEVVVLYGGKAQAQGSLAELLTIQDQTRIVVPRLEKPVLDRLLEILNSAAAPGEVRVDHPSMDLESFFLDVVRKAQAASIETAGARTGGRVAEYLLAGQEQAGPLALEALADRPAAVGSEEPPPAAAVDAARLAALAAPATDAATPLAPPAPAAVVTTPEQDKEQAKKASERLKSLLDSENK